MNLTALYFNYHDKSGEQFNASNQLVAAALLHIIVNYFSKWSSYFVLTLSCRTDRSCDFYNDMIYKMFYECNELPRQIVVVNRNENIKVPGLRQHNMIFTDSYEAFKETEIHFYTADYNYNEYYYIFLQTHDHLIFREMQKIFEYCWLHYLINCIIQIQTAKGENLFYTYYPFTEKYCGKVEPILINEFNGTSLLHEELFPKKLTNFYGCPLKAALWNIPPHLYLSSDSNNVTYISGGFEGKLLLELAKKLNFTLEIKIPENDYQRGFMLQNGSLTGALKMLRERTADISMGAFSKTALNLALLTSTTNYYHMKLSLVAISDSFRKSSLQTLLFPFTTKAWFLLLAVNVFAMFTIALLKHIYRQQLPMKTNPGVLDILLSTLGMPTIYNPTKNVSRILNTSWMMYNLIIRTMYQALLYHLIRLHVIDDVPQSLEELVQQQYSIVLSMQGVIGVKDMPLLNSLNIIALNSSTSIMALNYLENLSLKEANKFVAAVPLTLLQHYALSSHKPGIFKVLPQDIMHLESCMFMTKHSFLVDQLDELLVWIRGSGLINAWSRQEIDENYYNSEHLQADRIFGEQQLQVAFLAVIGGYIVASIVFILELLYNHLNCSKLIKNTKRFF